MGPFLFLLILVSCADNKSIRPGITSKNDLISIKGEPLKSAEVPLGEILIYKNNENFQISDNKVISIFREPLGDEKNLLFWRHQFKDCVTSEKSLNDDPMPEIELSCPSLGKSVVFTKGSGRVLRVGEYERH